MINVFQPSLGEDELNAIKDVFSSNWLGKGKKVEEFEKKFAKHLGVNANHVLTLPCCSEGLFSSMKILEISATDEVIIPTTSFVGAANAICANGSKIVFCDVNSRTLNPTCKDIETKITKNTKAVLLLHYGGIPCEMDEIMDMAHSYGIKVIEDSACSISSKYKGKACGTIGDIGLWSFDAMKILVSGDGGAIYIKDRERADFAEKLFYFGLESKSGISNKVDRKWWEFEVSMFGHRSIMNDVTASMALVQLEKLSTFISRRREIHHMYDEGLKDLTWLELPPRLSSDVTSSYYFYYIQLKVPYRDDLAHYLREKGIYTTFRYYPLHWVSAYGKKDERYPGAELAAMNTLDIPIHHSLSDKDIMYVIETIRQYGIENELG